MATRRRPSQPGPICNACGAGLGKSVRFCPRCGARVPASGEVRDAAESRRLVSVLYARLSDSETLDAVLDSEQARYLAASAVDALRREVERYAGRLIKFSGTEALAVFGIGQAHEDDPERSVTAALGFREAAAHLSRELGDRWAVRLAPRLGIATGEVVAAPLAPLFQPDDAVVGAAPTIARRLAESAEAARSELTLRRTLL